MLTFTDGTTGIFTSSVPEPASMAMLALGALVVLRHRR
jgi:hypothetical protein